jgi:hypothetical protein
MLVDSCGVLYKLRADEQFKANLGPTVWFATHLFYYCSQRVITSWYCSEICKRAAQPAMLCDVMNPGRLTRAFAPAVTRQASPASAAAGNWRTNAGADPR